jgi:putative nucleotidyltransferase with HDIG domain
MNKSEITSTTANRINETNRLISILSKANQIAGHTDIDLLLDEMLELITSICETDLGTASLFDKEANVLVLYAVKGDPIRHVKIGQRIPIDQGLLATSLREAQPIIIENLEKDSRWPESENSIGNNRLNNTVTLPLVSRNHAIGVLQVFNYQELPLDTLQFVCNRLASEIEKTILLKASHQRAERMETLVGIIKEMNLTLDRDLLLNNIIGAARQLLNSEASSLFLIDEYNGDMILSIANHLKEISLPQVRIPAGEGIIGHVIKSGETISVNDARLDDRHYTDVDRISGLETRSILAVPLRTPTVVLGQELGATKPRIIGGLEAINKLDGHFNLDDTQMLTTLADQAATVMLLSRLYADANELFIDTIKAITAAIDAKDPYTRGHSQRVSDFARIMAQEMGLPPEYVHHIRVGGLLHDVGKIGIPDIILTKPGKLTSEEYDVIKRHTEIGANIMEKVRMLQQELPALAEHHERIDGKGYPNGLARDEISLIGRIVAVADVFDALTSDRPYRKALSAEAALEILNKNRDSQLDGQMIDAMIQAYLTGKIKTQKEWGNGR